MFDFFDKLIGYVSVAFEFFLNLIESLLMAIGFMGTSVSFVGSIIMYMPSIIGTAVAIFLAIFVIKFLIGR